MIHMRQVRGRDAPLILCDACEQRITDHEKAHVLWNSDIASGPVYYVHKGICDHTIGARIQEAGGFASWDSLDTYLFRLGGNVGMTYPKDYTKAIEWVRVEAGIVLH